MKSKSILFVAISYQLFECSFLSGLLASHDAKIFEHSDWLDSGLASYQP